MAFGVGRTGMLHLHGAWAAPDAVDSERIRAAIDEVTGELPRYAKPYKWGKADEEKGLKHKGLQPFRSCSHPFGELSV
jgi:hypothetical protein